MHHVLLAAGKRADFARKVSFAAELACGEFGKNNGDGFRRQIFGEEQGRYLRSRADHDVPLFDAHGSGSIQRRTSRACPALPSPFSLPQFRIEEFFKTLSPEKVAEGAMDFSCDLVDAR